MQSVAIVVCLLVLSTHTFMVSAADCTIAGKKLNRGESYKPPERCIKYSCEGPGKLQATTCPSVAALKPCKMVSDVSKPYPECCPRFDC
ncbi:hypothetical protein KR018_006226 [Drosophila ironensis]|nr:hypothetical protein KR018_006226 [Drosophila ironensis]